MNRIYFQKIKQSSPQIITTKNKTMRKTKTKTKQWLTALFAAGSLWASAQTNFRCDNTVAGPGNPPPSTSSCGNILDPMANYNTVNDSINVNMVFFQPNVGVGIYNGITAATAQNILSQVNFLMANIKAPHLIKSPTPIVMTDSKIRFRLKSFSSITDSLAYIHAGMGGPKNHLYSYIDSNAINIFWAYDFAPSNCGGGGYAWQIPHYCISMGLCGSQSPLSTIEGLTHEFGHTLGLTHTDITTQNGVVSVNDVVIEGTAVWGVLGSCALTPPTSSLPYSNNIMGYNWQCRNYLSPQQIGYMKYLYRSGSLTTRFVHNLPNYSCNVNHAYDINITSNQTWNTPRVFDGDVTVKTGVHLQINCEVGMTSNSKFIIEKGAKVTLGAGGKLLSYCNKLWNGIEVQGDAAQSQYIDPVTNMTTEQGLLDINGGIIQDAKVGVALYSTDASGNLIPTSTGGIVRATNAFFYHNQISAQFHPYDHVYRDPLLYHNFSYFKNCLFSIEKSYGIPQQWGVYLIQKYKGTTPPMYGISLNGVRDVEVAGCTLNDFEFKTSNLINCFDASVKVQDYCTNVSGSTCIGTLINNKFDGGYYGIYISNISGYYVSLIDNANFGYSTTAIGTSYQNKGGIYINNASYSQISNNDFKIASTNSGTVFKYGIYADNSTGYIIEGNNFIGNPVSVRKNSCGIFINNSGPFANSVYNNTFLDLDQGLWAQNQNVDVSTGVGLKMNCNDFTTCKFNIGVQKSGKNVAGQPNNTGVDATQGIADPLVQTNNVRNTYGVTPTTCGSENKFYVNTSNTFFTNHGSFLGAQFHPTPQPACSNGTELVDIVGVPPSGGKSTFCPSTISSSFSSRLMQNKIEQLTSEIKKQEDELKNMADDTQSTKTASSGGKNVNGTMSTYQLAQAKLNLNKTELGLMINEKIRRLLNDSLSNATDSILDIVDRFNLPNKQVLKSAIYLAAKKYTSASAVINQNKNKLGLKDYCDLQKTALDFYTTTPNQRKNFVLQNKVQLQNWANSFDMFLEGVAKGLLAYAGKPVDEEMLYPVDENNMRLTQADFESYENNNTLKVYPNPANTSITVELENNNASQIELRDVTGKLLLSQKADLKNQIDLSDFENGIYFINLVEGKSTTHSSKIVLIK